MFIVARLGALLSLLACGSCACGALPFVDVDFDAGAGEDADAGEGAILGDDSDAGIAIAPVVVVDVAARWDRTCAVRSDGSVWCWGRNTLGELGDGTRRASAVPVRVVGVEGAIAIDRESAKCVLLGSGHRVCWERVDGAHSLTTSAGHFVLLGNELEIVLSGSHVCTRSTAGTRRCAEISMDQSGPALVLGGVVDARGGCRLLSNGRVECERYTGEIVDVGVEGVVALSSCVALRSDGTMWNICPLTEAALIEHPHPVVAVAAASAMVRPRKGLGSLLLWAVVVDETEVVTSFFPAVPGFDIVFPMVAPPFQATGGDARLALGHSHACVLDETKHVRCVGSNAYGQLGHGGAMREVKALDVTGIDEAVSITVANGTGCALLVDGRVACFGQNALEEAGHLGFSTGLDAVVVDGLDDVVELESGGNFACARRGNGDVWCWGSPSILPSPWDERPAVERLPTRVDGIEGAVELAVGDALACVRLVDDSVWCFGKSVDALTTGNGSSTPTPPTEILALHGLHDFDVGFGNICGFVDAPPSGVRCAGYNAFGSLGGSGPFSPTLVDVNGLDDAIDVSGFFGAVCALRSNGQVACWGNQGWWFASDDPSVQFSSMQVPGFEDTIDVSAGYRHVCAARSDGSVRCYGMNDEGELATADPMVSATPIVIDGIDDAVQVASGAGSACALRANGRVACWGSRFHEPMVKGAPWTSLEPVTVVFPDDE